MIYLFCLLGALLLFGVSYLVFRKYNMGLAPTSCRQQFRRYLIASVLAFVPLALTGGDVPVAHVLMAAVTSLAWIFTYNVTFYHTNKGVSPDFDNHMDIAFGIYLFGWLSCLYCLGGALLPVAVAAVVGIMEFVLLFIALAQAVYYLIYKVCPDSNGMIALIDTNRNEAIEFVRSFSLIKVVALCLAVLALLVACVLLNTCFVVDIRMPVVCIVLMAGLAVFFTAYIWKGRHGLFVRTGIVTLYHDICEYQRNNRMYKTNMENRTKSLTVERRVDGKRPHTIIMVIGESACRDYMSAYREQPWQTTPWESRMRNDDGHFVFFDNAYSCAMQTVPSLEMALTEKNLYNDKEFYSSCSVIDMARKAGYTTHWYSNQGHLGENDTPVTLVADTADTARWTDQELNVIQYDGALVDFLSEIDPEKDNFVVLHLIGSHFNYNNRYTKEYALANGLTDGDNVRNYMNSLHYTDHILETFFNYATEKLNLHSMIYFSDHGGIPEMRRMPKFLGFGMVRIPLWVYVSDEYKSLHPARYEALKANKDKYFTNDLAYELACGILDIKSEHFDEKASLASTTYRYERDMLLTDEGRIRLADDE